MAKGAYHYFGLAAIVEGSEEFVDGTTEKILNYVAQDCAGQEAQEMEQHNPVSVPLTDTVHTTGADYDVVAIYDDAGIPSIMHRFRRVTNKELFGGEDTPHPAFVIGGEVVDEIFISVYENTMIGGKPYSLPMMRPVTNITMEDFAQACFSKGEGWHCLTAAEWGLLANTSLKLGTLPHGNTAGGKWHGDETEMGQLANCGGMTVTGSGPAAWTHDHTKTGVHGLCGNIFQFCRGMRVKDGSMQAAENNDAALSETDLSENGTGWKSIVDDNGNAIRVSVEDGSIRFTTGEKIERNWSGSPWGEVEMECQSEQMKALAFFAGEEKAFCFVDSTDGEYILLRGGIWRYGAGAGVFYADLTCDRSYAGSGVGGRSAYYKKHCTLNPEKLTAE